MQRFFIDFKMGDIDVRDEEGSKFQDQKAAEVEARATLLGQVRYYLSFDEPLEMTIMVRDGTRIVFKATAQTMCRLGSVSV